MTRVSDNFFKLTTDIGDGYILRREGDIVTGISTQELLSGISGGSLPNTFPYTTYIDPNTTSLGIPDGSLSNPFLTINDAVSAIDSSIISLPEYIIKLAPGTYSSGSVVPILETTRNYHFVGASVDSTICSDWIITGSTGTIVFEQCNVISTGSWDQTGYNLTFINCSVDITSLINLIIPAGGLLRFIDTVGRFGGATISDTNTYLERDGRSKWGLVMNIPFVGNEPIIRDACAIPQSSNEYWVNNNNSAYKTNSLGWPVANGTIAHPYNLLGDCLDQLDILGIQYATVHLAPSNSAYVYNNANITTQLCIIGDGTVKNCRINQFTCESMILEVRNCYFLTSEFSVRMLKAVNCVIDANITIDTKMEFIDCKIEDDSNFIRVYTALTSAIWYVDLYSNYYSNIIPVTLVNIEKTILGDASGVDGYNIGINYIPINYSVPSSNIIGEHIAEIDSRLGNIVAGGIALSAGTNSKNSGTVSFVNSNGLSWGMDTAGAITGSISVTAGGAAISAGTNSRNTGTISFINSNGVSFGMDTAGAITGSVSVAAGGVAISAGSNSKNSGTVVFSNSNGVSFGMDTAGVVTGSIAVPAAVAISAGTNSVNSGTVVFSNSNGVSFGMNTAGVVTGSVAVGGVTGQAVMLHPNVAPALGFSSFSTSGISGTFTNGYLQMGATPFDVPNLCTISSVFIPVQFNERYSKGSFTNQTRHITYSCGIYSKSATNYTQVATTSWSYAYSCATITSTGTGVSTANNTVAIQINNYISSISAALGITLSGDLQVALPLDLTLNPGKYLWITGGRIQCTNSVHTNAGILSYGAVAVSSTFNNFNMIKFPCLIGTENITRAAVSGVNQYGGYAYSYVSQSVMPAFFPQSPTIDATIMPYFILG